MANPLALPGTSGRPASELGRYHIWGGVTGKQRGSQEIPGYPSRPAEGDRPLDGAPDEAAYSALFSNGRFEFGRG
ncbi:MAG: hypothetical protein Kilf2KO_40390 [Rhodospirillales bacterium]